MVGRLIIGCVRGLTEWRRSWRPEIAGSNPAGRTQTIRGEDDVNMRKVGDGLWWIGFFLVLLSSGILVATFVQWADLNVWAGTAAVIVALSCGAIGFSRIFGLKDDN